MKATRKQFLKLWGAALGSTVFIQVGSCDSQYPPTNADCAFGICIARKPSATAEDEVAKVFFADEVAGE